MENNQDKINPAVEETDLLSKTKKYKKEIVGVLAAVVVVVVAVLAWYFVHQSQAATADRAIAVADVEQNDSIALDLYKDAATHGTKSGDRAKIEVAIRLYQDGQYEEAAKYLDDASASDKVVAPGIHVLKGDCYVNLEKYDDAISAYDKAISEAGDNSQIVPVVLVKKANVYRHQKNYADEAKAYGTIVKEYPAYGASTGLDIKKYYERAKAAAGE